MLKLKRLLTGILGLGLILSLSVGSVSAESNYERTTWDQLEKENFDVDSITKEDVQKADEIAGDSLDTSFKEDEEGFATMDISAVEDQYGEDVANVFKLGLANINLDIEKGATEFAPDHKSFVKGPNYDKYVDEDNSDDGNITTFACTAKGGTKSIVGGAAGGAVTGAIAGGVGAGPGAAVGGMGAGIGYYATCWW